MRCIMYEDPLEYCSNNAQYDPDEISQIINEMNIEPDDIPTHYCDDWVD